MAMQIIADLCTSCGDCAPACPTSAIYATKGVYAVKADLCTECEPDHDMPQCLSLCMEDGCVVPAD
ncbi:4Fe-4S binding protein [Rhodovulum strictum]|uniref:Ferredoxin n=1 Tax=Rhodovulum strictum TaxID=58314 RepID=A0A844BJC9_9RHOB|nr:4Fe-4S binding protein [Rhodovulum strictum]MRH22568.1 ferredoxin [Rhodovulum strictum]